MALSLDFLDDILDTSKNTKRRYDLINNGDGTYSLEDVSSYSQVGTKYGAKEVIEERKAINDVVQSISDLKYKSGDTEEYTFWGGAMFTGGNKTVVFSVPTTKDMSDITEISVTSPEINIRQGGNYLAGSASSNSTSGFTVSCEKINGKTLKITVVFSSSIGGTNNDAVGLMFKGTLNFA